jgi:hypothetical protein
MKTDDLVFQRLLALLDAGNVEVLTEVLRLFYVMSKRSRFLSQQLSEADQKRLTTRLSSIAEVRSCVPFILASFSFLWLFGISLAHWHLFGHQYKCTQAAYIH